MKQSKLRKRRVIRYAILYFTMFVLFMVLIVGPVILKKFVTFKVDLPLQLQQPSDWNNNDTSGKHTGTGVKGAAASATSTAGSKLVRMMFEYNA